MSPTSSGTDASAGDAGNDRLWWFVAAIGALLLVAYLLAPMDSDVLRTRITVAGDVVAVAAILIGVRRFRPRVSAAWLLLAAGIGCWAVGDIVWGFYQAADKDPFPSWSDPFYLAMYPLFATGLVMAAQARTPGFDPRAVIDPAIVTVGAAFAAWEFIVRPVVEDPGVGGVGTFISVAYPVFDLMLLGVAVRLVLGVPWSELSLRALVCGLGLVLAGDVWYALTPESDLYQLKAADMLLLGGVLSIGLAGLHGSMTALTERRRRMAPDSFSGRIVIVVISASSVPVVLFIQAVRGEELAWPAAVLTVGLLAALVVLRYAFSATRARRVAMREGILRRYAAELLATGEVDDLYRVAEKAAAELAPDADVEIVRGRDAPVATQPSLIVPVDVDGRRSAMIVVAGDPTDLELQRDALASVASQLSLALERQRLLAREHEAARTLNEQNERLRELDRMKDQFVSSVSHELRSPLTSIVGYMELLLDGEVGELNEDQKQFLDVIGRNCTRLTKLVDDILFMARVDAGRLSLEMSSVDLGELATAAVQSFRPVALGKGVDLRLEGGSGMQPLWADPTRIAQLIDNLVSNAVKFTPEGGAVTVLVEQRGDSAHLEVRDSGVGIPKEEVGKLFDRFFRASTSKVAAGTGLGLSITKSIVESHRGRIAVESELGEGTAFLVDLPLEARQHAAPTTEELSLERLPSQ